MSSLSLSGLISGTNTEDMIRKIMAVERERITTKQIQQNQLGAKQKAWGDVRSALSTLQSKLDTLRYPFIYQSRQVTMTNESVATMTADAGAALTTHTLSVAALAQTHVLSHSDGKAQGNANDPLGVAGRIKVGTGTDLKEIDLAETDSLNSLADKINDAKAGLSAAVVKVQINGEDKYRLVLTAAKSGVINSVVMEEAEEDGTVLQALGFKDENGWLKQLSNAKDAKFTLDGIEYTRASNVVDDAVPGLTITLKKQGNDATTQAAVSLNSGKVLESVKGWLDAVNSAQALLKKLGEYNSETKSAGVLNGDSLVRNLQSAIRKSISNVVAGLPSDMNQMYHVGITTGAFGTADYGKVVIDEAKFKKALEKDADAVARLFGAQRNNVALASNQAGITLLDGSSSAGLLDVINGVTDNDRFGFPGGGWQSAAAPTVEAPQGFIINLNGKKMIDQISLFQFSSDDQPSTTHGLRNFKIQYWDDATATWKNVKEIENFKGGSSATYDFDSVTTTKVRLEVTATYGDNPLRIREFSVNEMNNGAAIDMFRYVRSTLASDTGAVDTRDSTLKKQAQRVRDDIGKIEQQLMEREDRLRKQFARMEAAMAKLRSQGLAFGSQLAGMM